VYSLAAQRRLFENACKAVPAFETFRENGEPRIMRQDLAADDLDEVIEAVTDLIRTLRGWLAASGTEGLEQNWHNLDEDTLLDALKAFDFYARMAKEPDAFNEVYELLLIELYVRTEAEDPQAQDDDDTGRTHGRRRRKRMRS